jgi:hypothetical protein
MDMFLPVLAQIDQFLTVLDYMRLIPAIVGGIFLIAAVRASK